MSIKAFISKQFVLYLLLTTLVPMWSYAETKMSDSLSFPVHVAESRGNLGQYTVQDPDSLFQLARGLAFISKNNQGAINAIKIALTLSPENTDFRIFLGRLYAWEGHYDSAAVQLQLVVHQHSEYEDARNALADVYLWSEQFRLAEQLLEDGLRLNPLNIDFLYKYAVSLINLEEYKRAETILKKLLRQDPENSAAGGLLAELPTQDPERKISIAYSLNRLADTKTQWQMLVGEASLDPWHLLTLEAEQQTKYGPFIGRLSVANRFGQSGTQFELEAYPGLRKGTYSYLGIGYSQATLFPIYRLGAEIFQALPSAFEVSLGLRYLHLETQDVSVFTASSGKYLDNYWLNVRTFITPQEGSSSEAWNFQCRKFLKDAETYLEMSLGLGESIGPGLGSEEISYLGSRHIAFLGQWKLQDKSLIKTGINLANMEVRENSFRGDTGLIISYSYRF